MTSKPQFRQINTPDVSDDAIASISDRMNVPTLVRSGAAPAMTEGRPAAEPSRQLAVNPPSVRTQTSADQHKLTVRIPRSLNDTLKRDALDHRTHVRTIILCALQAADYVVPASDVLAPDAKARLRLAISSRQEAVEPSTMQLGSPSSQQKLSIDVPPSLEEALKRDALKRDAQNRRLTVRTIVLLALKTFGYSIADADLEPGAGGSD